MTQIIKRKISSLSPYKIENGVVYIYLQKRGKDAAREPGLFGFFGGGTEENETPEETLLREIKKEINIDLKNFEHFNFYDLPKTQMDLYVLKTDNNFENEIKILDGDGGKWFSEKDYRNEKDFITGDLKILDELYAKLPDM